MTTISANSTTGIYLNSSYSNPVVIEAGYTISNSGAYGVDAAPGAWTIQNYGSIAGNPTTGDGILLDAGDVVTNETAAAISGYIGIYGYGGAASVVNFSSITGNAASGSGIDLSSGGSITNQSGAVISGDNGIAGGAMTVVNYGSIAGNTISGDGILLGSGGSVTNQSGAVISGQNGISGDGDPLTVVNYGSIAGNTTIDAAIYFGLGGGGAVTNQRGATITGHYGISGVSTAVTVVNYGNIAGNADGGTGVHLALGGGVTNQSGATISGYVGVYGSGGVTVVNAGSIAGNAGAGDGVELKFGGSVTNQSGATISGYVGVRGSGGITVVDAGTIVGKTDAVQLAAGYANQLVLYPHAVLSGTVDGGNAIGATAVSTLELASGASTGTLTGLGSRYTDFAQITIDAGAAWTVQGTIETGETVAFAGVGSYLHLDNPGSVDGSVTNFAFGDTIDLKDVSAASVGYTGGLLTFKYDNGDPGSFALSLTNPGGLHVTTSSDGTEIGVLCFCANTRILTPSGECPVQELAVGDLVTTWRGEARRIAWIGVGKVLATRARRNAATPVIVRKGALAPNMPHHDLRVTKGHAFYLDGALIPVEFLVNHRSIHWDDHAREVKLYHVELSSHDVLVANGAPAESYRDDGNRWLFQNANSGWSLPPQEPCAPVLTGGPVVDTVWRRLLERAGPRRGLPLTEDADLHLLVDGRRLDLTAQADNAYICRLAAVPSVLRIVSRAAVPAEFGLARDPRVLGVAVRRLVVRQGPEFSATEASDARLTDGFHAFEPDNGFRWTDGDAAIPTELFAGFTGPLDLILHIGGTVRYLADSPVQRAA
jgi:hypothetical protein